jgi:TolA-binding protein
MERIDLIALASATVAVITALGTFWKTRSEEQKNNAERNNILSASYNTLVNTLNERIDDLQKDISDLRARVEILENENKTLTSSNEQKDKEIIEKDATITLLRRQLMSLGQKPIGDDGS